MKTQTAKENIAALPENCYGVLLMDKSLIQIKVGESGYYPVKNEAFVQEGLELFDCKTTNDLADKLNAERGITKAQRAAMEHGSMFGWETLLANPENWEGRI